MRLRRREISVLESSFSSSRGDLGLGGLSLSLKLSIYREDSKKSK